MCRRRSRSETIWNATDCHVDELAAPAAVTFAVFIQLCLTLTAAICWNTVVYKRERQVYGLLLDAQLPRLAADQQPNTKDITWEQLPSCHMTRWPQLNTHSCSFKPTLVRSPPRSQQSEAARQTSVSTREVRVYPAGKSRSC